MKFKYGVLIGTLLFSISTMAAEKEKKIDFNKKTKSAIEFAEYIDTRPTTITLFETTTRELYHDKKEAYITDVGQMNPTAKFNGSNYGMLKKPFTINYSNLNVPDINEKTYPKERVVDDCNLTIVEYGLYVEGKFEGDKFIATNLKRKELSRMTSRYCYTEDTKTFQEINLN